MNHLGTVAQNDESWESLLSSQRKLLRQLQNNPEEVGPVEQNTAPSASPKNSVIQRTSLEFARRWSLGSSDHLLVSVHESNRDQGPRKPINVDSKKRRLSNDLGPVTPHVFEEKMKAPRRSSLLSLGMPSTHSVRLDDLTGISTHSLNLGQSLHLGFDTMHSIIGTNSKTTEEEDASSSESEFDEFAEDSAHGSEPTSSSRDVESSPVGQAEDAPLSENVSKEVEPSMEHPAVAMKPTEYRAMVEKIVEVMEKSQQTQQDIHDWDRKMGLKRSHSKTMRLSTRSRKKLRTMLRKELVALVAP